jgi:hypothetical protein
MHFTKPLHTIDIVNQKIWENAHITIGNKTVKYNKFKCKGLMYIQDIIDENGIILSKDSLERKYECDFKALEYQSLITAIPKAWKKPIKGDNQGIHFIINRETRVYIDKVQKKLEEVDTKDMYWQVLKCTRPVSEEKWREKSNINFSIEDWAIIYTLAGKLTKDTRLLSLQI